jgi:hypothetical protein
MRLVDGERVRFGSISMSGKIESSLGGMGCL